MTCTVPDRLRPQGYFKDVYTKLLPHKTTKQFNEKRVYADPKDLSASEQLDHVTYFTAFPSQRENDLKKLVSSWVNDNENWSMWVSRHLYANFNLPITKDYFKDDRVRNSMQAFFIGENKPVVLFVVTKDQDTAGCQKQTKRKTTVEKFTEELGSLLIDHLHDFCQNRFTIVLVILSETELNEFLKNPDRFNAKVTESKKNAAIFYSGKQEQTEKQYEQLKTATRTIISVTSVPFLLSLGQDDVDLKQLNPEKLEDKLEELKKKEWLIMMGPSLQDRISQTIESFICGSEVMLRTAVSGYTEERQFILIEAARRCSMFTDITYETDSAKIKIRSDILRIYPCGGSLKIVEITDPRVLLLNQITGGCGGWIEVEMTRAASSSQTAYVAESEKFKESYKSPSSGSDKKKEPFSPLSSWPVSLRWVSRELLSPRSMSPVFVPVRDFVSSEFMPPEPHHTTNVPRSRKSMDVTQQSKDSSSLPESRPPLTDRKKWFHSY